MKDRMTCERFRALLADPPGGASEREDWESHRSACPECTEAARRDAWLCEALARMPEETPPFVTWQQVLSGRGAARWKAPAMRLVPAFATAAIAVLILLAGPFPRPSTEQGPVETPEAPGLTVANETAPFTNAHALLSSSSMTGDPNRDVILLYSAPPEGRG